MGTKVKNFFWVSGVFTIIVWLVFMLISVPSEAATFTANSFDDAVDAAPGDGVCATATSVCTLRAAIQEANAFAGADKIVLEAGLYKLSIAGASEDAAATGDLDITDDVTIVGKGASLTFVNADSLDRVFHIVAPKIVKFLNLTIQNGLTASDGGGIKNSGGTVAIKYCTVTGNVAASTGRAQGGGIFNENGTMNISYSTISSNYAFSTAERAYAGGIMNYAGGTMSVRYSNIYYNAVVGNLAAASGGLQSRDAISTSVVGCKVKYNEAYSYGGWARGGGVYFVRDVNPAKLTSTVVLGNNVNGYAGGGTFGGGVMVEDANAIISGCKISKNSIFVSNAAIEAYGGGLYAWGAVSPITITVKNFTKIVSNFSSGTGGGAYQGTNATITVSSNSVIARNIPDNKNF